MFGNGINGVLMICERSFSFCNISKFIRPLHKFFFHFRIFFWQKLSLTPPEVFPQNVFRTSLYSILSFLMRKNRSEKFLRAKTIQFLFATSIFLCSSTALFLFSFVFSLLQFSCLPPLLCSSSPLFFQVFVSLMARFYELEKSNLVCFASCAIGDFFRFSEFNICENVWSWRRS